MLYDVKWRERIGKKRDYSKFDWRYCEYFEFIDFLNETHKLAIHYNWSLKGGGMRNFAVTLWQNKKDGKYISIRLKSSNNHSYYVSFKREMNPNNLSAGDYKTFISSNIDGALKYLHTYLLENEYEPEFSSFIDKGAAYQRYDLQLKWAQEEQIEQEKRSLVF